ncbi:MAG: HEAT repeat domain-containing protein, partial [Planctomycetes bacterium]|nr:HEAT repeat domain-containing protein [Planctomycetota bacterium]
QFILGSVATALGQIGDERALEPLISILRDEQYPELTRALAAVALGQIGDKNDVSVLSRVSRDVNYRAYYDAIGELLTIL